VTKFETSVCYPNPDGTEPLSEGKIFSHFQLNLLMIWWVPLFWRV